MVFLAGGIINELAHSTSSFNILLVYKKSVLTKKNKNWPFKIMIKLLLVEFFHIGLEIL